VSSFIRTLSIWFLALSLNAYGGSDPDLLARDNANALRQFVPAMSDGADAKSVADFFAPMQMRVIGENDPTWKRDNLNWSRVLHLISNDLKKDLELSLAAQAAENAVRWNRELATHLSAAQIDELLKFYRSDTGHRYLAFQKRLMAVQVQGASALIAGMVSGGVDPKQVAESTPSAAQIETRKRLVALSWIIQVTPAMGAAVSPSHGVSASDDKAMRDMVIDAVATTRGTELDALRAQYHADLAAFATFHASSTAKALMAVYRDTAKDAAAQPVKPGTAFTAALEKSIAQHTPAWKAAYEAGRVVAR
jgi:hypothetical protein